MTTISEATRSKFFNRRRRKPARPTWSARSLTVLAIFVTLAVAIPTILFGPHSLLVRAEWVTAILAALLWTLLFVGLYRGARVKKTEPLPEFNGLNEMANGYDSLNTHSLPDVGGGFGADDLIGGVVGFVLWIVVGLALLLLLPMLLTGVAYLVVLFVAAFMWIFRRALRQVFVRGPRCRGRLGPSMMYASVYTLLYAGWLLGILTLAHVSPS